MFATLNAHLVSASHKVFGLIIFGTICLGCGGKSKDPLRPNVLFISIDDLNDWVGALGGHPDAKTPNIDRLREQSLLFTRAYTAAPLCNPSRTAILTGVHPHSSGIYKNKQPMHQSDMLKKAYTLPQYFRKNGYKAIGSGKVFHYHQDTVSWDEYWPAVNKIRPDDPVPRHVPLHGMPMYGRFFDWGPLDVPSAVMGDWQIAEWISEQLQKPHDRPFFMACGFYKPHLPWYIPKEYFGRFPIDEIALPKVMKDDLNDIPKTGKDWAMVKIVESHVSRDSLDGDHLRILKYNKWKEGIQAYLAAIAFADDCLGKVLDALANSPHRNNTIVVIWSDHGYHLGEKMHWRKSTLWEESTRSLLMFKAPGITRAGTREDRPVSLIDIYPSLIELCELPPNGLLEGRSLVPLLKDPSMDWTFPAVSTFGYKNHSIRSERWRYIRYSDGSEELYDHETDSLEWYNLARDPQYDDIKTNLARWLPTKDAPPVNR